MGHLYNCTSWVSQPALTKAPLLLRAEDSFCSSPCTGYPSQTPEKLKDKWLLPVSPPQPLLRLWGPTSGCVSEGGSSEYTGKQIFTETRSVFNLGELSTGRHEIEPLPDWIHPRLASVPVPDSHKMHWKKVRGFCTRHQELLKALPKILNNLPCCSYSTGRGNEIYEKHDLSTQLQFTF